MVEVAIPSHGRPELVWQKAVALLLDRGVPWDSITIWVADEEERLEYERFRPPESCREILVCGLGLGTARNVIVEHYPTGTWVVEVDDDLEDVRQRLNEREHEPLKDLPGFWAEMFQITESAHLRLWGVYPMVNALFMKPHITFDLRFIVGAMFGIITTRDEPETTHIYAPGTGEQEDRERTLRYFCADGGVARCTYVGIKKKFYREEGGIARTPESHRAAMTYVLDTWPHLTRERAARKSGFPEIRLIPPPR